MVNSLALWLEASGCETTCLHCNSQGSPYKDIIEIEKLKTILSKFSVKCKEKNIKFFPIFYHERLSYPNVLEWFK